MKSFAYRAVHSSGKLHKGTLRAENENELSAVLGRKNLELISAKALRTKSARTFRTPIKGETERLHFTSQMEDLLRAGLPFTQALSVIIESLPESATKDNLLSIESKIRAGASIKQAFESEQGWFDPVSLAILEAGEESGKLPEIFARLARHFKKQQELRMTTRRALRYPLFLLTLACCVTCFMMLWVVPQILTFLIAEGRELPLTTRILMTAAELFSALWWLLPASALSLGAAYFLARRFSDRAHRYMDALLLRVPFIGTLWHDLALARWSESLTLLLTSGVPLPKALLMAHASLGNKELSCLAQQGRLALLDGTSFSIAMQPLFSPFLFQLVRIGEQTGTLHKMLDETAKGCEKKAQESLSSFLGALEPALTVLVGALLAWIVLAVLGPLYTSLGVLSGGM
jgi:type IV pilus assembly protein PilC